VHRASFSRVLDSLYRDTAVRRIILSWSLRPTGPAIGCLPSNCFSGSCKASRLHSWPLPIYMLDFFHAFWFLWSSFQRTTLVSFQHSDMNRTTLGVPKNRKKYRVLTAPKSTKTCCDQEGCTDFVPHFTLEICSEC
jgi:hypothetical protein